MYGGNIQVLFCIIFLTSAILFILLKKIYANRYKSLISSFINNKYISTYKNTNILEIFHIFFQYIFVQGIIIFIYKLILIYKCTPYDTCIYYYYWVFLIYYIFIIIKVFIYKTIAFLFSVERLNIDLLFIKNSYEHILSIYFLIFAVLFFGIDFNSIKWLFYIFIGVFVLVFIIIQVLTYTKVKIETFKEKLYYFFYICAEFVLFYMLYLLYNVKNIKELWL